MREIKFRVWLKDKQVMEKVRSIEWAGIAVSSGFIKNIDTISDRYYSKDYNGIENYIIMQYTGLKDANGKEIYEGDIVKITNFIDMKTIYEIIWNEEVASFEYKDGPYINEYGDIIPGIHYPNECTVVGNICENPELLN
jgi:uncharacterized phage protein (TIGR01671 family)